MDPTARDTHHPGLDHGNAGIPGEGVRPPDRRRPGAAPARDADRRQSARRTAAVVSRPAWPAV